MGDGGQRYKFPVYKMKISGNLIYSMVAIVDNTILCTLNIANRVNLKRIPYLKKLSEVIDINFIMVIFYNIGIKSSRL